jgi:molybdopterin molybdotransferase
MNAKLSAALPSPSEAWIRMASELARLPPEPCSLERAQGRVLSETLYARVSLPRFAHSAVDGYALAAGAGSSEFEVAGEVRAGASSVTPLKTGCAARIFTGAPLPEGADAVVMQEHVVRAAERVHLCHPPSVGQHVRRAGEDLALGDPVLERGTRLKPTHLALCRELELEALSVTRRPRVVVITTGDELRGSGAHGAPGTRIDTNGPLIADLALQHGATVVARVALPDSRGTTELVLDQALREADVVFTIGGVSVGDHDHVRPAAEAIGVRFTFAGVELKPGKPLSFGVRGGARLLALPGNPLSAWVTFMRFGVPLLRALLGHRQPDLTRVAARLAEPILRRAGRTELVPARLRLSEDGALVWPIPARSSGSVVAVSRADALIEVSPEANALDAGATVSVLRCHETE